jgi:hypothetical protein
MIKMKEELVSNQPLASLALTRLPEVRGHARVIEPGFADLTDLNRYMLLRSHFGGQKANDLGEMCAGIGGHAYPEAI